MNTIRANDGGYLLNADNFKYDVNENGQKVLSTISGSSGGGNYLYVNVFDVSGTVINWYNHKNGQYGEELPTSDSTIFDYLQQGYGVKVNDVEAQVTYISYYNSYVITCPVYNYVSSGNTYIVAVIEFESTSEQTVKKSFNGVQGAKIV